MPLFGSMVQNGKFSAAIPDLVRALNDDIAQPVVPAVSAAGLELGDARGHVEFVVGHQDGVRGDPEESRQRRHGLAAAVHVGSRDQQTNVLALVAELADQAEILAVSHEADALGMRQALNEKGPRVMPGLVVFRTRVSQANDQLYGSHDGSPSL